MSPFAAALLLFVDDIAILTALFIRKRRRKHEARKQARSSPPHRPGIHRLALPPKTTSSNTAPKPATAGLVTKRMIP